MNSHLHNPFPPEKEAEGLGLHYISNQNIGITRKKVRSQFVYLDSEGKVVKAQSTLNRIQKLVIPPAWDKVWICPDAQGHIQATGRDLRGRKQYIYHPVWRAHRDSDKFEHMLEFARVLPKIRRQVRMDLSSKGLSRQKVIAALVRLLERTLIRVGNIEYARTNRSYGISTLLNKHVKVRGTRIEFDFRGKSGKEHHILLQDSILAKIVKRCQELPGQELFEYLDEDGEVHRIGSEDINDYIRSRSGREFTAKDFRTWIGTVLAAHAFSGAKPAISSKEKKRIIVLVIELVSTALGNTPAICRKSYIHPEVFKCYQEGIVIQTNPAIGLECLHQKEALRQVEKSVLTLLERRLS